MKYLAIVPLALGLSMMPASSQDAPKPRIRPGEMRERMQGRMEKALNLTEAQKASVKEIRAKHKAALESKRDAAMAAHKAFMEAFRKPEAKAEDLRTLHRAMADANLEAMLEHRAVRDEIHAILTPEQREKAARLQGRMEGMRMGHRGEWPGMGMGMGGMR
jgi:Spy/CpxP family protein refolding chaperone